MPKPKAKTFQQKLGFFDDDLKNQTHDDILKWINENASEFITEYYNLTNWNNLKYIDKVRNYVKDVIQKNKADFESKILNSENKIKDYQETIAENELCFKNAVNFEKVEKVKKGEYSQSFSERIIEDRTGIDELNKNIKELESKIIDLDSFKGLGRLPKRNKIEIVNLVWEPPISTMNTNQRTGYKSSKYIIGFLDLMITFRYHKPTVTGIDFTTKKIIGNIGWEQTTKNISLEDGYVDGYIYKTIFIEAKTKITSLGELFRQLRTYKEYISEDIIVVCPNDDEKDLILNQGFGFYKYKVQHHI